MGRSERARQSEAYWKDQERRMGLTPYDNWAGKEIEYIEYLMQCPSYKWVNGELKTMHGYKSIEIHFHDYLEDTELSCYHRAIGHGYRDWMIQVKDLYLQLRAAGKLKKLQKKIKKSLQNA
jgi:hypothetical protein